jgi:alpha-tubulin suppressor-like RCC1 family protein
MIPSHDNLKREEAPKPPTPGTDPDKFESIVAFDATAEWGVYLDSDGEVYACYSSDYAINDTHDSDAYKIADGVSLSAMNNRISNIAKLPVGNFCKSKVSIARNLCLILASDGSAYYSCNAIGYGDINTFKSTASYRLERLTNLASGHGRIVDLIATQGYSGVFVFEDGTIFFSGVPVIGMGLGIDTNLTNVTNREIKVPSLYRAISIKSHCATLDNGYSGSSDIRYWGEKYTIETENGEVYVFGSQQGSSNSVIINNSAHASSPVLFLPKGPGEKVKTDLWIHKERNLNGFSIFHESFYDSDFSGIVSGYTYNRNMLNSSIVQNTDIFVYDTEYDRFERSTKNYYTAHFSDYSNAMGEWTSAKEYINEPIYTVQNIDIDIPGMPDFSNDPKPEWMIRDVGEDWVPDWHYEGEIK